MSLSIEPRAYLGAKMAFSPIFDRRVLAGLTDALH